MPTGEPDLERPPLAWEPLNDGPIHTLPRRALRIAGMELTQSIQHHGAAGESFGPDNSVPLVALKTMIVRVYPFVRPGLAWPDVLTGARITGELVLSIGNNVIFRTGPTRLQGARVGPQSDLARDLWDQELTYSGSGSGVLSASLQHLNPSLNFYVPGWYCRRGRVHVAVRIWRMGPDGAASPDSATAVQYVEFLNVRPPKIALVRVNWDNGMGGVTRPSDADMLGTLRLSERMLPFPYFETTILDVEQTSTAAFAMPVTGGACNQAWQDLNTTLAVTRIFTALFGLGDIVFGMVPRVVIPPGGGSINSGCGIETGGCIIGENDTFAHELCHLYDRAHVAVPGDSSNDPNYPRYGGHPRSIGETGIDTGISPPTLYDPSVTGDIMTYRLTAATPPLWISPYTYRALLDARDMHQTAPADPRRVRPLLFVAVRIRRTAEGLREVEFKRSFKFEASGFLTRNLERATSPLSIDLLNGNRQILATHHCYYIAPRPGGRCGCGGQEVVPLERQPYIDLFEVIEWPGEAVAALSAHQGAAPLATMAVGEPPRVEIEGPERREDRLIVRVRAEHPRATPAIVVLFSADDGVTWVPVGFDPPNSELSLEAARLRGGPRCRFRAIASAELQSATADTEPFEHAGSPRRLHLDLPKEECGLAVGPVALSAFIDTRGLGPVAPHEIRWHSSLQGELGAGYELIAELGEGEHVITATAPDGRGGSLAERGIIIVSGHSARQG